MEFFIHPLSNQKTKWNLGDFFEKFRSHLMIIICIYFLFQVHKIHKFKNIMYIEKGQTALFSNSLNFCVLCILHKSNYLKKRFLNWWRESSKHLTWQRIYIKFVLPARKKKREKDESLEHLVNNTYLHIYVMAIKNYDFVFRHYSPLLKIPSKKNRQILNAF